MSVIVIFLGCVINSTVPLSPDSEIFLPWLIYGFPEMSNFCQRGKGTEDAAFPVGSLRLRPHPPQDSWSDACENER